MHSYIIIAEVSTYPRVRQVQNCSLAMSKINQANQHNIPQLHSMAHMLVI